jgi:hypothetical protein
MPNKTHPPAPGAGKPSHAPAAAGKKSVPHWQGKGGKGAAPMPKPLRLPGKGRGG